MNRIQIVLFLRVILEAEPAELMPAWTGHMRAPGNALDGDLAAWALVSQKDEVY